MRGCLSVLVLGAVFVVAVAWFAGPVVAGALGPGLLGLAGFHGSGETVEVRADPPIELLVGRADLVHVRATDASYGGIRARTIDVSLHDANVRAGSFGIDGTLTGVWIVESGGVPIEAASVTLSGDASNTQAAIHVDGAAVEAAVRSTLTAVSPPTAALLTGVRLDSPNLVTLTVAGRPVSAKLAIDAGGAVVLTSTQAAFGSVILFEPVDSLPLRLRTISIAHGQIVVVGSFDVLAVPH